MITKLISIFQHKMRTDNLVLGSKSCALPDWYKVGICFTQVATTCCVVRRNWIRATTRCRHSLSQADTPLPTKWTPASLDYSPSLWPKKKGCSKRNDEHWVSAPSIPFRSIHRLIQSVLPQLTFSFYRHQPIRADFSGGQITSDAGLLPLRAFDERHHLTRDWAESLSDPRQKERVQHDAPALLRQRIYQIVAGYEDANDADRLRHDPLLQVAFPGVKIRLRGDAGFALPLLYQFCEFFQIEYALGIPANCVFKRRAESRQKRLKRRYRRTQVPQRSFTSFRHRARSWPRQRRICYKAEHTSAGTNLRFVITNCAGCASQVFAFYNDRGECENRIEEFKNGFRADRLSCHRFLANAFRLLLHGAAYNLVNFFRHYLPQPWRSAQIETLRAQLFKLGARIRQTARCVRFHLVTGWPFQSLFRSAALAVNSS